MNTQAKWLLTSDPATARRRRNFSVNAVTAAVGAQTSRTNGLTKAPHQRHKQLKSIQPVVALDVLVVASTSFAQNSWVLWRRFVPADDEAEAEEYRALDPHKRLLDPAGRQYSD